MEVLKQDRYAPMPVEDQVVSLYVAVQNHLADVEVSAVRRFEEEWLRFLHSEHEEILDDLRTRKELTDDIRATLDHAVAQFKERFGG
jgi:F-type H+-transporting ATPase subunit alpha